MDKRYPPDQDEARPAYIRALIGTAPLLAARIKSKYGKSGAPGLLELSVHASPGPAEIETNLVYGTNPVRRVVSQTRLTRDAVARVSLESTR